MADSFDDESSTKDKEGPEKNSPTPGTSGCDESEPNHSDQASSSKASDASINNNTKQPEASLPSDGTEEEMSDDRNSNSSSSSSSSSSSISSSSTLSILNELRRERHCNQPTILPAVLLIPKPKNNWVSTREIVYRQYGSSNRKNGAKIFQDGAYGSLHFVQRLELMYKLEEHKGCVNALGFNESGNLLASVSDDLRLCLWDWAAGKLVSATNTFHRNNIFQCKFLPLSGIYIATCARDGEVRLIQLSPSGERKSLKRLGFHTRPSHKIALLPDSPFCFLSCGEDGAVIFYDVREPKQEKLLKVKEGNKVVPLFSISCNPLDTNEFMVGGQDRYLRLYDRRDPIEPSVRKIVPLHLNASSKKPGLSDPYITSAVYNYNGTELLASYNDDDIYLWDRSEDTNYAHRYQGHRNKATVKGVNFFGPRSEYIVSGSDDRYIYFWDKETEAIVQWLEGDENGAVNCLEPHPSVPVLATSGLDDDVKIWVPSREEEPDLKDLKQAVISNVEDRVEHREDHNDLDSDMLWLLWRNLSRRTRTPTPPLQEAPMSPRERFVYLMETASSSDEEETGNPLETTPGRVKNHKRQPEKVAFVFITGQKQRTWLQRRTKTNVVFKTGHQGPSQPFIP